MEPAQGEKLENRFIADWACDSASGTDKFTQSRSAVTFDRCLLAGADRDFWVEANRDYSSIILANPALKLDSLSAARHET